MNPKRNKVDSFEKWSKMIEKGRNETNLENYKKEGRYEMNAEIVSEKDMSNTVRYRNDLESIAYRVECVEWIRRVRLLIDESSCKQVSK